MSTLTLLSGVALAYILIISTAIKFAKKSPFYKEIDSY